MELGKLKLEDCEVGARCWSCLAFGHIGGRAGICIQNGLKQCDTDANDECEEHIVNEGARVTVRTAQELISEMGKALHKAKDPVDK